MDLNSFASRDSCHLGGVFMSKIRCAEKNKKKKGKEMRKNFPAKVDLNLYLGGKGCGVPSQNLSSRKSRTFRQLQTNQPQDE